MTTDMAHDILTAWEQDKDRITPGRYKYDLHAMIGAYLLAARRLAESDAEVERLRAVLGTVTLMGVKPRRSLRQTLAELVAYGETHRYPPGAP
jgi:hypothetical protein